jgi:hypothetical protein
MVFFGWPQYETPMHDTAEVVGIGSVSVVVKRSKDTVVVYTLLPGFRANSLLCARHLQGTSIMEGSPLDIVRGETADLPLFDTSSHVHSLVAAVATMATCASRCKWAPLHPVLQYLGPEESDVTLGYRVHQAMVAAKVRHW